MPSSHEEMVTMGARPAQERLITIGKTWRFLAAASVVLGLLTLFGWGLTHVPKLIPTPLIGKEAPLFALELFEGGTFQLGDQRGQVSESPAPTKWEGADCTIPCAAWMA